MTDRNREMVARAESDEARAFLIWMSNNNDLVSQRLLSALNRVSRLQRTTDKRVDVAQAVGFTVFLLAGVGTELADAFANFKRSYNVRN